MVTRLTQDIPPEIVKLGPQVVGFFQSVIDNLGGSSSSGVSQTDFDALETRVDTLEATDTFTSADQTITSAGTLTIPHGLGAAPSKVWAYLICQSGERGYTAGDVVAVPVGVGIYTVAGTSTVTADYGFSLVVTSTNLNVRFATASVGVSVFLLLSQATGLVEFGTNDTAWKLRLVAAL
jgi:hypothetical protein